MQDSFALARTRPLGQARTTYTRLQGFASLTFKVAVKGPGLQHRANSGIQCISRNTWGGQNLIGTKILPSEVILIGKAA